MPNWCYNDLTITGKPKMINKLLKQVKSDEQEFDFNNVIPMPNGVDWYSWCIDNWGTKWNACDVTVSGDWEEGEVNIYLETAWSPPEPVFRKLAEQNPTLTFIHKTYEEGMSFYGTLKYKGKRVEVLEEGSFTSDTPCAIYESYMGDSYHHYCNECHEHFECEGEVAHVCPDCKEELDKEDTELWKEELHEEVIAN